MKNYLHRVQVLRFVAAAMVLVGHVQHQAGTTRGIEGPFSYLGNAVLLAGGVDIFFVISGFIMFAISKDQFGVPNASRDFVLRRLARILPPYWLFTTLMVAAAFLLPDKVKHDTVDQLHLLASYLFVPATNPYGEPYPVLALGWTLNFEMLFYAVFAVGLIWKRPAGFLVVVVTVALLGAIGMAGLATGMPAKFWCNPIVYEFLMGMLLARLYASGYRMSPAMAVAVLVAGCVLMWWGSTNSGSSPFWMGRSLFMGVPALLVCAAATLAREPERVGAAGRLLALGGDASYALYLSHPFVLAIVAAVWRFTHVTSPWAFMITACVASVVVAVAFHLLFERPTVRFLNGRINRLRPLPVPVGGVGPQGGA